VGRFVSDAYKRRMAKKQIVEIPDVEIEGTIVHIADFNAHFSKN